MDKPITYPVESEDEIADAIAEVLTVHLEDHGIGAYEYAGARGVHSVIVPVIDESRVLVDVTKLHGRADWLVRAPKIKGRLYKDDNIINFSAEFVNVGTRPGKVVAEFEIE